MNQPNPKNAIFKKVVRQQIDTNKFQFEPMEAIRFQTNLSDAINQLDIYLDLAKQSGRQETIQGLERVINLLNSSTIAFEKMFSAGQVFAKGYFIQETRNVEMRVRIKELEKEVEKLTQTLNFGNA